MDRIKARFVGQFKRSELGMVSHGAFLQSKSLQSIYLSSYHYFFKTFCHPNLDNGLPGHTQPF